MKKIILLGLCFLMTSLAFSDQITKIAVVDYNQILSVYYEDSRQVRQIAQFEEEIKEEIIKIDSEIKEMEADLLDARSDGDARKVLSLEEDIEEKRNYLVDYIKVKRTQLAEMKQRLSSELTIVDDLLNAMQYVAESSGFSLVLRKDDPSVMWYSYDVDITEDVLKHLLSSR